MKHQKLGWVVRDGDKLKVYLKAKPVRHFDYGRFFWSTKDMSDWTIGHYLSKGQFKKIKETDEPVRVRITIETIEP